MWVCRLLTKSDQIDGLSVWSNKGKKEKYLWEKNLCHNWEMNPYLLLVSIYWVQSQHSTVEPLLSGLLRCGHLPLPDIIKSRVVFVLFVFVKSIWAGHPVWSRARALRLSHLYSVLHYIILVSLAYTTRRKRSVLTLEKKLEIIGELKKGKSLRCVSGLYDVPKSTVVLHSQTL